MRTHDCDESCYCCSICYQESGIEICSRLCGCFKEDRSELRSLTVVLMITGLVVLIVGLFS